MIMTFIEYWNEYKKQYNFGEDYVDVDCGEFIAICPSRYCVMHNMEKFKTKHCVTHSKEMWDYHNERSVFSLKYQKESYFGEKYKEFMNYDSTYLDLIKVFFFRKNETNPNFTDEVCDIGGYGRDINTIEINQNEFTGWLSPNASKIIDYFHLQNNLTSTAYPGCKKYYDNAIVLIGEYIPKIVEQFNIHRERLRKKLFEDVFHKNFYESGFYKANIKNNI